MNCKPGDLAMVMLGEISCGRIVTCQTLIPKGQKFSVTSKCGKVVAYIASGPVWLVDGFVAADYCGTTFEIPAVIDAALLPIRDPGDDARDEMLRPLPQQDKVPA